MNIETKILDALSSVRLNVNLKELEDNILDEFIEASIKLSRQAILEVTNETIDNVIIVKSNCR